MDNQAVEGVAYADAARFRVVDNQPSDVQVALGVEIGVHHAGVTG